MKTIFNTSLMNPEPKLGEHDIASETSILFQSALTDAIREKAFSLGEYMIRKEDINKKLRDIVVDHGYPFEQHHYETEDGYINTIQRISGARGTKASLNNRGDQKPIILYQHGLIDSSAAICCNGKDSIPFVLADQGFDVWMNNSRGNNFSREHALLDPNTDEEYWDFSW